MGVNAARTGGKYVWKKATRHKNNVARDIGYTVKERHATKQ